ncbi:MAG: glycosyltransferase family 4 protein [Planctomycetota bacterium]|nr:glycosyltransferase family 4 protein [Planctomycetota bacterium]
MRIVVITDFMDLKSLGGSTRVVLNHCAELAKRGHEIAVISGSRNRSGRDTLGSVCFHWFHYEPDPERRRQTGEARGLLGAIAPLVLPCRVFGSLARTFSPEAVMFHQPLSALSVLSHPRSMTLKRLYNFHSPWCEEFLVESLAGQWTGAPPAVPGMRAGSADQGHSPARRRGGPAFRLGYGLRRNLERQALRKCRAIVVLSDYMRSLLGRVHPGRACPVHVIPGAADTARFFPAADRLEARRRTGVQPETFLLSTVRRLIPRMGIPNLIEAVKTLRARGQAVRLLIGGSGPIEGRLKDLARELNVGDDVGFTGNLGEEQMRNLFAASDLVVVPTLALEGFGLVAVEALACGTPVLGTPVGGIPEVLSPLDRRLVCAGADASSIADGIRFWMERRDELELIRAKCRQYVCDRFTWGRAAERIENALLSMIGSSE